MSDDTVNVQIWLSGQTEKLHYNKLSRADAETIVRELENESAESTPFLAMPDGTRLRRSAIAGVRVTEARTSKVIVL